MEKGLILSLVRHGRVHNPLKLFYGRMPRFGLSRTGFEEAYRAARFFKSRPVAAVFSSPLLRSLQTARTILAFHPALELKKTRLLLEVHTPWDGMPAEEVDRRGGDVYSGSNPPFEQPQDVLKRVRRFFRRVRKSFSSGHVVAVTHGDVIAFWVLWVHQAEVSAQNKASLNKFGIPVGYPATGSITTFSFDDDDAKGYTQLQHLLPPAA